MRLRPVLVLTIPLVAVAACNSGPRENVTPSNTAVDTSTVEPMQPGHITVSVSCRDTGNGIGVHVRPWKAHSGEGSGFVWNLVPANDVMPTEITPVDPEQWPFAEDTLRWNQGSLDVPVERTEEGSYKYRLRIVCPAEADTIVIDPIVIIDPSVSTRPHQGE